MITRMPTSQSRSLRWVRFGIWSTAAIVVPLVAAHASLPWYTRRGARDDERNATQYNYTLFHVIFFLSTAWVATLLTSNFDEKAMTDFVPVGRTYWASWAKIISAWVCYAIYAWSLVAPLVMPDRFDY